MRATRAVIHLENLRHNIREIRTFLHGGTHMCVAVKADAYGHGAVQCARAALSEGADFLAVATVDEGRELREAGITEPVLMLSLCAESEAADAVRLGITPLVFDAEYIDLFAREAGLQGKTRYPVHLAVDTGMGRIGCRPKEAADMARHIERTGILFQEGTCTHFAMSDSLSEEGVRYTAEQFRLFTEAADGIRQAGLSPGICHCANSAALLDHAGMQLDMVRPGIIVYGYYADEISREYLERKGTPLDLRPVMTLETQVSAIRDFDGGMSVGYGRTWRSPGKTQVAVLPVGYGDGWLRRFSQCGVQVAIRGKGYPVRGRICMDQCMVELGEKADSVRRWDTAVLFGSPGDGALQTADDLARLTGTISYEITSCITKRVPRVYTGQ